MQMVDNQGNTLGARQYTAYGQTYSASGASPTLGYAGMLYHAPSGLYLTPNRAYNPGSGRWLSRDPIGEDGGLNSYGYVGGNPTGFIDPDGLEKLILLKTTDPNYAAAMASPDVPGVLTITSHGSQTSVRQMNASQLAAVIEDSGLWTPGMPIKLDACRTGRGKTNIAMDLSRELGVPVTAPNGQSSSFGSYDTGVWNMLSIPGTALGIGLTPGMWITYSIGQK